MNDDAQTRQSLLLEHLNQTFPNNNEQQVAFDSIMTSILSFKNRKIGKIYKYKGSAVQTTKWRFLTVQILRRFRTG